MQKPLAIVALFICATALGAPVHKLTKKATSDLIRRIHASGSHDENYAVSILNRAIDFDSPEVARALLEEAPQFQRLSPGVLSYVLKNMDSFLQPDIQRQFAKSIRKLDLQEWSREEIVKKESLKAPKRKQDLLPPVKMLSYAEFESLVKHCVSRVPDLKPLWAFQKQTGEEEIYFSGGGFRGLLHWITVQLQTHSARDIRKMRVPTMIELLLNKTADRDLFVPDLKVEEEITAVLPKLEDYDFLDDEFMNASLLAGGGTIEKTGANPKKIRDPLNGLPSYYRGILVFKEASQEELLNSSLRLYLPNRTALALRFLRVSYDLSEAKPDRESMEALARIPELHAEDLVQRDDLTGRGPYKVRGLWLGNNVWVHKGIYNLYEATGEDVVEFISSVKNAGLLHHLMTNELRLQRIKNYTKGAPAFKPIDLQKTIAALERKGFDLNELIDAAIFIGDTQYAPWMKNLQTYRLLISKIQTSDKTQRAGMRFFAKTVDQFLVLKPAKAIVEEYRKGVTYAVPDGWREVVEKMDKYLKKLSRDPCDDPLD